jgi:transposase
VWVKRVWRCMEAACPVSTWSEASAGIRPGASWTERARAEACRRVGEDAHSVAQVASSFGVAWATAMAAVVEYGSPRVDDPQRLAGVSALGVDETAFLAAKAKHHTQFVTGMVDLTGSRLLDVIAGRC